MELTRRGSWLLISTCSNGFDYGLGADRILGLLEGAHERLDRVLGVALLLAMALPQAPTNPIPSETQTLRHLISNLNGTVLWHPRSQGQPLGGFVYRLGAFAE